jgi:uncharacterized protein
MSHASGRSAGQRIVTLDAVRGFALLGIVAVHMVEQYLGSPPPASRAGAAVSIVDGIAMGVTALFFMGKFFAMFSLLFGLSFFIQMDRAASRGQAFEWRFTWRLAILFVIGMVHHLVYRGDILATYAVLGLVLLAYYRASDRVLLGSALAILLGVPRLFLWMWAAITGSAPSMSPGDDLQLQAYWDTIATGTPAAIAWINLTDGIWPKLQFQFGWFGRGYQTLGLFLLGLYIGRHRFHEDLESRRPVIRRLTWRSLALSGVALLGIGSQFGIAYLAGALPASGSPGAPPPVYPLWFIVAGFTFYDLFNLGVMGAFAGGFLLLYYRPGPHRVLRWFAPVGQTALTTYVAQSVIGALIFYGYGLGALGEIGAAAGLGLAVLVFALQAVVANAWLRAFRFGPLEWFWRSGTYLRVQPLARKSAAALPEPA